MASGLRAAYLVGSRLQAADPVVIVGVDRVEVEAEDEVPPLHHYQLVTLVLHHRDNSQSLHQIHPASQVAKQTVDAHPCTACAAEESDETLQELGQAPSRINMQVSNSRRADGC